MFTINPITPIEGNSYTALIIYVDEVPQAHIDALSIPKYVGKLKPQYGITINLTPNAQTGEVNERGIKRVSAFLKAAAGHYRMVEWRSENTVEIEEFCEYHNIKLNQ